MKKILVFFMLVIMLCSVFALPALAHNEIRSANFSQNNFFVNQSNSSTYVYGYIIDTIATRSGPGTNYPVTGNFDYPLNYPVMIRSRAWDAQNRMWWVEVCVDNRWLWTGYHRIDPFTLPLESIPITTATFSGGNSSTTSGPIYGYVIQRLSTRSGPGTNYRETGSYQSTLHTLVQVRARAWDARNDIWWVEVLIGDRWLWTGYKRFDPKSLPLESLPVKEF